MYKRDVSSTGEISGNNVFETSTCPGRAKQRAKEMPRKQTPPSLADDIARKNRVMHIRGYVCQGMYRHDARNTFHLFCI